MKALILIASVLGTAAAMPAFAQSETYETPKYMPAQPTVLDPNYGLPSFGMPGATLPQQRTQAPEPVVPEKPDVFKSTTDFTVPRPPAPVVFALPKAPGPTAADATASLLSMETPQYTTTEGGSTTGTDTSSEYETR